MDKIVFDRLPLIDLQSKPVDLSAYFQKYLLLIFLRHLA
jgi:hypothetical protein